MRERVPHEELLTLRRTAPVSFVEQAPEARAGFPEHRGYWAVSKHADVAAISKDQANFSTNLDGVIIRFGPDMDREGVENTRFLLINHDAPDHTKLRQIVSRAFTPRAISALHDDLQRRSREIVAEAVAKGEGNFVEDVAAELPLQAIAGLLGVPQEDRGKLFEWSNQMMSYDDPEVEGDEAVAFMEILGYSMALADERRKNPQDDIITKLVTRPSSAPVGEQSRGLTDDEFGFFMVLLAVAGNETTRNAISHGMHAFFQNPDQWELYKATRPATAGDEIIRWATPVTVFQRTAINDVEVGGAAGRQGRAGRDVLRERELRRGRVHRPVPLRHHPRPQPAPGLRRPRRALLHRRQPGPARGQPDLRRAGRPGPGDPSARGAAAAAARLDQRRQGPPGRLPLAVTSKGTT